MLVEELPQWQTLRNVTEMGDQARHMRGFGAVDLFCALSSGPGVKIGR